MEEAKSKIMTCLEKEEAFCTASCPFHLDMREFMARMKRGGFNAAFRTYSNTVGFPGIVAEACDEPCKSVCPGREEVGAIEIKLLEKAAINYAVNTNPNSYNMPGKEKKIAIIGAGISGLACALRLANRKYKVEIYEKTDRIGGHLWGIMPPEIFLADIKKQFMYEKYELHLNAAVNDLKSLDSDAIYIATGSEGTDFNLSKRGEGNPMACSCPGVFLGGSILGATTMEALAQGLRAAALIENYLKTGNMKSAEPSSPTRMCLDFSAKVTGHKIMPSNGASYSKDEAVAEAKRCIRCQCDACFRHCDLMNYFNKFPKRIQEEVEVTIHPGTLDGNGTVATRLISTCNQCGLCKEVCPQDIDMGDFLLKSHRAMHEKGAMPWAFHDFWLRDMEFAGSEKAGLMMIPDGYKNCEYLFFPGCQLGASDPEYVLRPYRFLLEHRPDTALMLACCGAPAVWAGDEELHHQVMKKLMEAWESSGKPKFVFACPTCRKMFEDYMPEIEGVFLYDLLLQLGIAKLSDGKGEAVSVFDPCSSRNQPVLQQNIRKLAVQAGYKLEPLPYEGKMAKCCSFGGQISTTNPPYAKWMVQNRISEKDVPYIAYCANCRDIFAKEGKLVKHILDILFNINDWERKPPTISERRRNREKLKRCILEEFLHQKPYEEEMKTMIKLRISPELKEKLNKELLLEEDILSVVEHCESSGRKVIDPETGHCFGYMEIGRLTYWVEYRPLEEEFELINAYSHRMKIELEEVWNGRKQETDL